MQIPKKVHVNPLENSSLAIGYSTFITGNFHYLPQAGVWNINCWREPLRVCTMAGPEKGVRITGGRGPCLTHFFPPRFLFPIQKDLQRQSGDSEVPEIFPENRAIRSQQFFFS